MMTELRNERISPPRDISGAAHQAMESQADLGIRAHGASTSGHAEHLSKASLRHR